MKRENRLLIRAAIIAAVGLALAGTAVKVTISRQLAPLRCGVCEFDLHRRSVSATLANNTGETLALRTVECRWANRELTGSRWLYSFRERGFDAVETDTFLPHTWHPVQTTFEAPNVASTTPKEIIFRYSLESDPNNIRELHCKPRLR